MTKLTMKCSDSGFPCKILLDDIDIAKYVSYIQISSSAKDPGAKVTIELFPTELEIDIPNVEIFIKSWLEFQEKQQAFSRLVK